MKCEKIPVNMQTVRRVFIPKENGENATIRYFHSNRQSYSTSNKARV